MHPDAEHGVFKGQPLVLGQNAIVAVSQQLGKMNHVEVTSFQPLVGVERDTDVLRTIHRMRGRG